MQLFNLYVILNRKLICIFDHKSTITYLQWILIKKQELILSVFNGMR